MRYLPDAELRNAIGLLGELEVGAPGLVELALRRLDLDPDHEAALGDELRSALRFGSPDGEIHPGLDGLALSGARGPQDLRELAAFDLAIDAAARETLEQVASTLAAPPDHRVRLRVLIDVLRLVRNPDSAEAIARALEQELGALVHQAVESAPDWIVEARCVAGDREARSPEVAGSIWRALRRICTPEFVREQVVGSVRTSEETDDRRDVTAAFGELAAPAFVDLLEQEPDRAVRRHLVDYLCQRAERMAPGLLPFIEDERWRVVRNVVRVLGFAGRGYEGTIGSLTRHAEARVAREAFLALARVGSGEAVVLVLQRLEEGRLYGQGLAEEALWRFPTDRLRLHVSRLLELEYCRSRPALAQRIVEELADPDEKATADTLRDLARSRWHFWRPATARVGRAAGRALRRAGR